MMPAQPMKTTVLFLAANPDGVSRLALDKECRAIREKIRASEYPNALELKTEWAVRPDDLLQYRCAQRQHPIGGAERLLLPPPGRSHRRGD